MKKLISILVLSTLVLSGCGTSNQVQQNEEEKGIVEFLDEDLDVDDWGKHKKKVVPKTGVNAPSATKPTTSTKSSTKSSTTKKK